MNPLLDRQREYFVANPADSQAFAALEEGLFLANEWQVMIEVYQHRLGAACLATAPRERAELQFRMGQLYQDQLNQPDEAAAWYRDALLSNPGHRSAMSRMRKLHAANGQWEVALQIAEAEAALPQQANEHARLFTEMGSIWLDHFDDAREALVFFSRALDEYPDDLDALEGSARAFEADDRPELAAGAWDRAIDLLRGPARARALIARARLAKGPLAHPAAAADLYRRALSDAPADREALDAVVEYARAQEKWPMLLDLQERRFELLSDVTERAAIAIESGQLQLNELENPAAAQMWFERAEELDPDNPATSEALADLARGRGDDDALLSNLERAMVLWDGTPPVSMLLELASLHSDRGDAGRARDELELAFECTPDDSRVAEALSEILARLGENERLIELLEQRAAIAGPDNKLRAAAIAELASIHEDQLGDSHAACDAFARAFEADPNCPGVASALERLYRKFEDWNGLRSFLEAAAETAGPDHRAAFRCALAAVLAENFDAAPEAMHLLELVLDEDPHSTAAHRGLQHIAHEVGDEEARFAALQREAAIAADPARLAYLVGEIATRFEERGDLVSALDWIELRRTTAPDVADVIAECARLHDRLGHDAELIELLEQLEARLDGKERAANRRRIGNVHARFDRHDEAIDAYRAALDQDADDLDGLRALEAQLEHAGRVVELADVKRQIAERVSPAERAECLKGLSALLADRLGDIDAAIDALAPLCNEQIEHSANEQLEALLQRAARYEELADHLGRRVGGLSADDPKVCDLTLRRAQILLENLADYAAAADSYRWTYEREPDNAQARDGLERAVRAAGDPSGLALFLGEQMQSAATALVRERCGLECAVLLEETLDREPESREILSELAGSATDPEIQSEASRRLEEQLERSEEWEQLRAHLEASLGDEGEGDCRIHERLGTLYRDRLRNWPRAIDQYEAATTIAPERADLWRILASLYEQEGDIDALVTAIEAEIATAPESDRELSLRSRAAELCVHRLGDADRAQDHYQRVLELEPTHSAASDFLLDFWERKGDPRAVVSLLEMRLGTLEQTDDESDWPTLRASLRLRIAQVRTTELDDLDGAIIALQPAIDEVGAQAFVAQPLADLYERAGRTEDLVELCRRAASSTTETAEHSNWFARQGGALERIGLDRDAAVAYRKVLKDQPNDRDTQAALRDIYRRLEDHAPLVRMLELELSQLSGSEEIPVRLELASLLDASSSRLEDALLHLRRVLALQPDHADALAHALDLSERLQRTTKGETERNPNREVLRDLIDAALAQPNAPAERAVHLAHRARLNERSFEDPDAAIADYRESLSLDRNEDVIAELRSVLSRQERWEQVLDCVFQQASTARGDDRVGLLEQAVEIAWDRLGPESALPWLTRLRRERPEDIEVLRRIADTHRQAARPEAALRALEAELSLVVDPDRQFEIHRERATLLEDKIGCPARAAAALEDARTIAPTDTHVLKALADLYCKLERPRDRARTLEASIAIAVDAPDRTPLQREIAQLYLGPLANPRAAANHLRAAVIGVPDGSPLHTELLRDLGRALRAADDPYAWASCAERELRHLDPNQNVFAERRLELHRELAQTYEQKLGQPDMALRHLRKLTDARDAAATDGASDAAEEAESKTMLRLLRAQGDWIEYEARLSAHLDRHPNDPKRWLELAQLRDERLRWTRPAAHAYHRALERDPGNLAALRGLRSAAERLGNWREVAQALEDELEFAPPATDPERAALQRRLGDVYWRRLESTTSASRSYASALESHPDDLVSLHALQQLLEAMEDWRGAMDLYESEIEMLADAEPERRAEISTRIARLAHQHADDSERAIRNYAYAAQINAAEAADVRALAELYEARGDHSAFAATFETWCDAESSPATCLDHMKLAKALGDLGRGDEAVERIERALALDPEHGPAWDIAARLREEQGNTTGAAEALSIAAQRCDDGPASSRLVRSAELSQYNAPEVGVARLRQAILRDPAAVEAHARLACLANELGDFAEAELSAGRALDLAETIHLDPNLQLQTAMSGGYAALECDRLDAAVRCFSVAAEIAPDDPDALAGYGEALAARGEIELARKALRRRLALDGPNDRRAVQLALVAKGFQSAGDFAAAEENYEAALGDDPRFDEAHASLIQMWKSQQRLDKGVACLERWADLSTQPSDRAQRLLRAAEWELAAGDATDGAERHLREVLDADPSQLRAWESLTSLLWDAKRSDEALQVASLALGGVEGAQSSQLLALVMGRALDAMGELDEAAEAFRIAAAADPCCVEAALSRARLLRALGDWSGAADALREFADAHDDGDGLSEVLQQLGRLLAGPLEDPEGAIAVYRRAIVLDPERLEMRAALAEFLSYRPDDWPEALVHHQKVLNRVPTHNPSLRILMRISRERGNDAAMATGLGIVRAIGFASAADLDSESSAVRPHYAGDAVLADPLLENLRLFTIDCAHEIAIGLGASEPTPRKEPAEPLAAFHAAVVNAERRLMAPTLLPLTDRELGDLMRTVCALVVDPDHVSGDGKFVNAMSTALKWRTRRKLRRLLEGVSMRDIEAVDFAAWRRDVSALACAVAVDETKIELRVAVASIAARSAHRAPLGVDEGADLSALIEASDAARGLLRRAVGTWLTLL